MKDAIMAIPKYKDLGISLQMDAMKILLFIATMATVGMSCPGSTQQCLEQTGFMNFPTETSQICTTSASQLLEAEACIKSCNYPPLDRRYFEYVNSLCSRTSGCGNLMEQLRNMRSCYGDAKKLKADIDLVITLFNSRLPNEEECSDLRATRSCMKHASSSCPHLGQIYKGQLLSTDRFDLALLVCGAEGVELRHNNDACSEQMNDDVERHCGIACDLSSAQTAGDLCRLLQNQVDCIEGRSKRCSKTTSKLLYARLFTLSFVNQLFKCNITVKHLLVKPQDYNRCDYQDLFFSCFDLQHPKKITFKDVQRYVNADFLPSGFCSKVNGRASEKAVEECSKKSWACLPPVGLSFETVSSMEDFTAGLGTFPINDRGLRHAYQACTLPPNYQLNKICPNPLYNAPRSTTLPPFLQA